MKLLQDNGGNESSMRLGMFICILTGCGIAIMGVYLNRDLIGISSLVLTLVGAGIGGKVMQKGKEG